MIKENLEGFELLKIEKSAILSDDQKVQVQGGFIVEDETAGF